MKDRILSQKQVKYKEITKLINEYASLDTDKLIKFLYDNGYNESDVARALRVSRQWVNKKYPKIWKKLNLNYKHFPGNQIRKILRLSATH